MARLSRFVNGGMWVTAVGMFLLQVSIHAQPLCVLTTPECIELTGGGGSYSVTVPYNVTRLDPDGLSICLTQSDTVNAPVDVIFVVDQSGSMNNQDPTYYAPTAVRDGLALLDSMAGGSNATVLRFGSNVSSPSCNNNSGTTTTTPAMTLLTTGLTGLQTWTTNNVASQQNELGCGGQSTNYIDALTTARTIVQGGPLADKAIIFITDGAPTVSVGGQTYDQWIVGNGSTLPPVYSIFIGGSANPSGSCTDASGRLNCLANITGGSYNGIPANNPVALANAMSDVVRSILFPGIPDSTFVTNSTTAQSADAYGSGSGTGHVEQPPAGSGNWQVFLSDLISIDSGTNAFQITSHTTKNGVIQAPINFNLTINATDPAAQSLGDINLPDSLFDITCVEPSSLIATNLNYTSQINSLAYNATQFGVQLNTTSGDPAPQVSIAANGTNDAETLPLNFDNDTNSISRNLDAFLARPTGTPGNSTNEEILGGSLYLKWTHPRDSRDTAVYTLAVDQPTVANPQANPVTNTPFTSNLSVQLFSDSDTSGVYPGNGVTIFYTTDGSDPATSVGGSTLQYSAALNLTVTTTIRAIATRPGWANSQIVEFVYPRTTTQSVLQVFNQTGQLVNNGTIFNSATSITVRLSTNQQGLGSYTSAGVSNNLGDTESIAMGTSALPVAGFTVGQEATNYPFDGNGSAPVAGRLDANPFDTLVFTWTNPQDAGDVATATVYVQPANGQASVHFSTSASLDDTVTAYAEDATPVYVIVQDQTIHPDSTYTVRLTTNSAETEIVTLTLQGGVLVGSIPAAYAPVVAGNGSLQPLLQGDVISAVYVDPFFSADIAQSTAEYAARTVAIPVADVPDNYFFDTDTTVGLSVTTTGAQIRYTLDGSDPTFNTGTLYTGTRISLTSSTILKAVAYIEYSPTNFVESPILTRQYNLRGQLGFPWAVPASTYFTESIQVYMVMDSIAVGAEPTDSIYYTTDGTDPKTSGTRVLYTDTTTLITFTGTTTLSFYAFRGAGIPSENRSETYTKRDTLVPPTADPGDSTIFFGDTTVVLSHPVPGVVIRYTTDGTDPDANSPVFTAGNPPQFTVPTTIRARAFNPPGLVQPYVPSAVAVFRYIPKVEMPVADPGDTTFTSAIQIQLSTPTPNAQIFYTWDNAGLVDQQYVGTLRRTSTDTLRAVAIRTGWAPSDTLVVIYTRDFVPSTIEILDVNQQPLPYLSEINTTFSVRLLTTEVDLSSVSMLVTTFRNGDSETFTVSSPVNLGTQVNFTGLFNFRMAPGAAVANDNFVTSGYFDSVIVEWVNPNNPQDAPSDTIRTRPRPQQADVFFASALGNNPVTIYNTDVNIVYIGVTDQIGDTNLTYQVTVTTEPRFGNRVPDTLTLPLIEISPGLYGVAITVDKALVNDPSDNALQALKADLLTAVYQDPMDGDADTVTIQYGQPGEVTGSITFVDGAGLTANPVANGIYWDPNSGSVYLRYVDDYTTQSKRLTLSVVNTTGTGTLLFDNLQLDLTNPIQQDSVGIWLVTVPMNETATMNTANVSLEVFFEGEITASISSHNRNGVTLNVVTDVLQVANPNENAVISITNPIGDSITRPDSAALISINDQCFSSGVDTILADVRCVQSGDFMLNVRLVETGPGTCVYEWVIDKNEGTVNQGDNILTCLADDAIEVTYYDPIYGDPTTEDASWGDFTLTSVQFVQDDNTTVVTSLDELNSDHFRVRVEALSPNPAVRDTVMVTITTSDGDQLTIAAIETDVFSGVYVTVDIPVSFRTSVNLGNSGAEGIINFNRSDNEMTVTATVTTSVSTGTNDLTVTAGYVQVTGAEIIDGNGDGSADTLFLTFAEDLPYLPEEGMTINWPDGGISNLPISVAAGDVVEFCRDALGNAIQTCVIVVPSGAENGTVYAQGVTSLSTANPFTITLPNTVVHHGVTINAEDGMGPILTRVVRDPSDGTTYPDPLNPGTYLVQPDTLNISLSEAINIPANAGCGFYNSLIQFSYSPSPGTCATDSVHNLITLDCSAIPVPGSNGLEYQIIVTNSLSEIKPIGEFCAWINPNSTVTDVVGNSPGGEPVPAESLDPNRPINDSYIYVPIVIGDIGSGQGQTLFENINVPTTWLPPVGYNPQTGVQDLTNYGATCAGDPVLSIPPIIDYPFNCISTVRVLSEGGYTAEISIYDHLGKYLNSSVQRFGGCGELFDPRRVTPGGRENFLIWNTRDADGEYVANGVYIWKVKFIPSSPDLPTTTGIYKQGIARSGMPEGCWSN